MEIRKIWLHKTWDLNKGYGYHVQVYFKNWNIGYGFHKTNKFTAVREAAKQILLDVIENKLRPITLSLLLPMISFASSTFIGIWYSWSLSWKIALTSFILIWIIGFIRHHLKKAMIEKINRIIGDQLK